jgi:hypothetical protein
MGNKAADIRVIRPPMGNTAAESLILDHEFRMDLRRSIGAAHLTDHLDGALHQSRLILDQHALLTIGQPAFSK